MKGIRILTLKGSFLSFENGHPMMYVPQFSQCFTSVSGFGPVDRHSEL
jgi:hypothetical protein